MTSLGASLAANLKNTMAYSNKKYDLRGKVALVTGASSGIGAAIAIAFAGWGAKVAITGRNAENLEKVRGWGPRDSGPNNLEIFSLSKVASKIRKASFGSKPLQVVGDLQDDSLPERLINQTIAEFGKLDILVNNAGGGSPAGTLSSASLLEEFDATMKLNVRSVVDLTQRAAPHLEKTKGNVINISSVAGLKPVSGRWGPCPGIVDPSILFHQFWLVYCTTKAALDMVTKTSALELGPRGIRVNSINPGPVATELGRSFGLEGQAGQELIKGWSTMTVLQRVAASEEIAMLAGFLASNDGKNITGAIMVTDGGLMVK